MQTTYRLTTNDGHRTNIKANSAAEAIEECLWRARGCTVIECHSGLTEQEAETINMIDSTAMAMPGLIHHDIPPHEPVAEDAVKPKTVRRLIDTTEAMFAADEMVGGQLAD